MEQAIINLVVAVVILLAIAMILVAACRKKEKSRLPSPKDPEMIRLVYYNTLRIEDLKGAMVQDLAAEIMRKYVRELPQAQSLPVIVRLEDAVSNAVMIGAADLLIKSGWLLEFDHKREHCEVQVTATEPRKYREKPRRKGVIGGVRYW